MISLIVLVVYCLRVCQAFELGSEIQAINQEALSDSLLGKNASDSGRTVAIIGAGAAGSSAAFWIGKGRERLGVDVTADIYEAEGYIGGRSTVVYPYNSTQYVPVELGASIFVDVNKNMMRAAREFNLSLLHFEDNAEVNGVWDGEKFIVFLGGSRLSNWWNLLQVIRRYGWRSPKRTIDIVNGMIKSFLTLYTRDTPRWRTVAEASSRLNFTQFTEDTLSRYMEGKGVDRLWTHEVIEAATRVNYGQNADEINGLGGAVSMAADDASGVEGGNYQIFENFVNRSGATIFLNTPITSVKRSSSSLAQWEVSTAAGDAKTYDAVIIATPQTSSVRLSQPYNDTKSKRKFVHLHVTLIATTAERPSATFFNTPKPPKWILTTRENARNGGPEPEFNSLTYHETLVVEGKPTEYVVKIFSKERISDEWLNKAFDGQVGWVYRKEWDAYPYLLPRPDYSPVVLDQGLYHVNAFE
ncbi:FAD/NAD(P)-binding domain-containing protein, partial [Sistotremastrum niveocremeum HHB9708]